MKKIFLILLCCCMFSLQSNSQNPTRNDSIPIIIYPIDPIGTGEPIFHAPVHAPTVYLCGYTLYIYAYAEKQVSIYPVDYDDETDPLYTTFVLENTFSCVLPSWLEGVYAIEIEINGIVFVGEIEL